MRLLAFAFLSSPPAHGSSRPHHGGSSHALRLLPRCDTVCKIYFIRAPNKRHASRSVYFALRRALIPLSQVVSRRLKTAMVAGCAAGVCAVAGFGPVVRYQAERAVARYGGTVSIEHVVPSWHGARLRGVDVALAEVPSTRIHLDEVEVEVRPGGRVFEIHGGIIAVVGARDVVLHEVESWRARHMSPDASRREAVTPVAPR